MKRGNLDVPWFQYKVTILLHLKLKMQDTLLTKLQRQFIELHNTQFFKRLENIYIYMYPPYCCPSVSLGQGVETLL